MPVISRFFGIAIRMFFNEHAPPHFHAEYGGRRAVVNIRTLEVIEGLLSRGALELVLDWAELHRDELLDNLNRCQQQQQPTPVAPLE